MFLWNKTCVLLKLMMDFIGFKMIEKFNVFHDWIVFLTVWRQMILGVGNFILIDWWGCKLICVDCRGVELGWVSKSILFWTQGKIPENHIMFDNIYLHYLRRSIKGWEYSFNCPLGYPLGQGGSIGGHFWWKIFWALDIFPPFLTKKF
jgi:hypothetical protein